MIEIGTEVEYQGPKVGWTGARGLVTIKGTVTRQAFVEWFVGEEPPRPINGWYKNVDLKVVETPAEAQARARVKAETPTYPGALPAIWRERAELLAPEGGWEWRNAADELEAALNELLIASRRMELAQMTNEDLIRLAEATDAAREARD